MQETVMSSYDFVVRKKTLVIKMLFPWFEACVITNCALLKTNYVFS